MGFKIIQPSTNPDTVGRGGVIIPGTPDQSIQFPTGEGTVALISDIPNTPTIYPLTNTYTDVTTNSPQVITEWDIPVVNGKIYEFEYTLVGDSEKTNYFNASIWYQTSSFVNPLYINGYDVGTNTYIGNNNLVLNMTTLLTSPAPNGTLSTKKSFAKFYIVFEAKETNTLRHLFQSYDAYTSGYGSSSFYAGRSVLKVTELN